jgi:hypothetical protein
MVCVSRAVTLVLHLEASCSSKIDCWSAQIEVEHHWARRIYKYICIYPKLKLAQCAPAAAPFVWFSAGAWKSAGDCPHRTLRPSIQTMHFSFLIQQVDGSPQKLSVKGAARWIQSGGFCLGEWERVCARRKNAVEKFAPGSCKTSETRTALDEQASNRPRGRTPSKSKAI